MGYIKLILSLLFVAYLTSPLWEEPASDYVDVSFLNTIDAQIIKGYEYLKDQPFIDDLSQKVLQYRKLTLEA